jgi:hypothetical protein
MRILALDLGKFKSVACGYDTQTLEHGFETTPTTANALHDLIIDREPERASSDRDLPDRGMAW